MSVLPANNPSVTVSTENWSAAELIGGKSASDLQTGLTIGDNAITGTLKYVTGYTQFSGDVSLQSGNFMVVKIEADVEATIEASLDGTNYKTLDSDGILIARITDKDTQKLHINATYSGGITEEEYDLSGLTLTPAPVEE